MFKVPDGKKVVRTGSIGLKNALHYLFELNTCLYQNYSYARVFSYIRQYVKFIRFMSRTMN